MSKNILIVDYGLGNLFNVERAFQAVGGKVKISSNPNEIIKADRICLPGVAAFGAGIKKINELNLFEPLIEFSKSGKPMIGLCLGMQLLLTQSEEHGIHKGLNIIPGKVVKIPDYKGSRFKVPHIGWSSLEFENAKHCLKDLVSGKTFVYFVHSYYVVPEQKNVIFAETSYGPTKFCSVLRKDNVQGCQFHPERSSVEGLTILKNFMEE